jgi:hypothetical protein
LVTGEDIILLPSYVLGAAAILIERTVSAICIHYTIMGHCRNFFELSVQGVHVHSDTGIYAYG